MKVRQVKAKEKSKEEAVAQAQLESADKKLALKQKAEEAADQKLQKVKAKLSAARKGEDSVEQSQSKLAAKAMQAKTRANSEDKKAESAGDKYLRALQNKRQTKHDLAIAKSSGAELEAKSSAAQKELNRLNVALGSAEALLLRDGGVKAKDTMNVMGAQSNEKIDQKAAKVAEKNADVNLHAIREKVRLAALALKLLRSKVAQDEIKLTEVRARANAAKAQANDDKNAIKSAETFVKKVRSSVSKQRERDTQRKNQAKTALTRAQTKAAEAAKRLKLAQRNLADRIQGQAGVVKKYVENVRDSDRAVVDLSVDAPTPAR